VAWPLVDAGMFSGKAGFFGGGSSETPEGLARSGSAPEISRDELTASMTLGARSAKRGSIAGGVALCCQRQENPNISAYGVFFDLVASFSRVKVQHMDFGTYAGREQKATLYLCNYGSGRGHETDPDAWSEVWAGPIGKRTRVTPQDVIEVHMNKVQGVFIHCAGDGVCLSDKGKNAMDQLLEIRPGYISKSPQPFKPFTDDQTKLHTHAGLAMYVVPNVVYHDLQELREDYEEKLLEERIRREHMEKRLRMLEDLLVKQGVVPELPPEEPLNIVKGKQVRGHVESIQAVESFLKVPDA